MFTIYKYLKSLSYILNITIRVRISGYNDNEMPIVLEAKCVSAYIIIFKFNAFLYQKEQSLSKWQGFK